MGICPIEFREHGVSRQVSNSMDRHKIFAEGVDALEAHTEHEHIRSQYAIVTEFMLPIRSV